MVLSRPDWHRLVTIVRVEGATVRRFDNLAITSNHLVASEIDGRLALDERLALNMRMILGVV